MEEKSADMDVGRGVIEEPKNTECGAKILSRSDSADTSGDTSSSGISTRFEEKAEQSTSVSEQTSGIETGSGTTSTPSTCVAKTDATEGESKQLPRASDLSVTEIGSVPKKCASEALSKRAVEIGSPEKKSEQLQIAYELSSVIESECASELPSRCVEKLEQLPIAPEVSGTTSVPKKCASEPPSGFVEAPVPTDFELAPSNETKSCASSSGEKAETPDVAEENSESTPSEYSESECSGPAYRILESETTSSSEKGAVGSKFASKIPNKGRRDLGENKTGTTGATRKFPSVKSAFGGLSKVFSRKPKIKQPFASERKNLLSDQDGLESEKRPEKVKKPQAKPAKTYESAKARSRMFKEIQRRPVDICLRSVTKESSFDTTSNTDMPSTLSGAESLPIDSGENTPDEAECSLSSSLEDVDIQPSKKEDAKRKK